MLLTISMILRLVLKCSKLHANLVDLMDMNAVKALELKRCNFRVILRLKCSELHTNLVDLMAKNAVKALKGKNATPE